jgi:prevent-host-death family protein
MVTINIAQAREELPELLNRVVYGNERVVVTRYGKPLAAFISVKKLQVLEMLEEVLDFDTVADRLLDDDPRQQITIDELRERLQAKDRVVR